MKGTAIEYLNKPYSRTLIPIGDGTYFAEILEFPGCFAEGKNPNEAYKNLEKVAESWIEAALDQGQEIPEPFAIRDFSGRIALRIPKSIHKQSAKFAEMDGTSLNQFFLTAVAARVGAEEFYERLSIRLEAKCMTFAMGMPSLNINLHNPMWATGPFTMVNTQYVTPALPGQSFVVDSELEMAILSGQVLEEEA
jgi:predicted RNase H-like HicB family nuclease